VTTRPAPRPEYRAVENAMFFPKLRRQAKWMFVFLALVFALGFVVFGVGSGGGLGLGDILQNVGASGGPSVKSAKKKIAKGDATGYKELADAYRNENKQDLSLAAGEQYASARPKDFDFMRNLASDYEGKAARLRNDAQAVQDELNSHTGANIALPTTTPLGRMLGQTGNIDRELTTIANQKLTEQYTGIQKAYTRATELYQRVAAAKPDDVLLQLLLAQSAYQARLVPTAEAAYKRVIKMAPDSPEAAQARQQLSFLRLQSQAAGLSSR
jgi:tetratricopeptide (TPR) repeat protein